MSVGELDKKLHPPQNHRILFPQYFTHLLTVMYVSYQSPAQRAAIRQIQLDRYNANAYARSIARPLQPGNADRFLATLNPNYSNPLSGLSLTMAQIKQRRAPASQPQIQMSKRKYSSAEFDAEFGPSVAVKRLRVPKAKIMLVRNRAPKRAYVKGAVAAYGGRQELKYVDTALSNLACDTTGSVTALNLVAVGDDNNTRDGRQVTIKSVQLKGITIPQDSNKANNLERMMLVWDNANNSGALPAVSDILTSATSVAFPKIDNAQRFTVLWDWQRASGALDTTATSSYSLSPGTFAIDYYKKINQVTQYSGTTAAIGSIANGSLLLVTIGNQAAGAADTFYGQSRVRFTDM